MSNETAVWYMAELAWAGWLRGSDYDTVTHLGLAEGNTRRSSAPLMAIGNRDVRTPDISTTRQGKIEYWEVKYRNRPFVDQDTGELGHWMPYDALSDYVLVSQRGAPVHVVLFEAPTSTAAGRWLIADVDTIIDNGRRARRHAHDGRTVDAWIWRRSAMRTITGPAVHTPAKEHPLLEIEGEGNALTPDALESAEQSLRARRKATAEAGVARGVPHEDLIREDPIVGLDVLRQRLGLTAVPYYSVWLSGLELDQVEDALALIDYGIRVYIVARKADDTLIGPPTRAVTKAGLLQVAIDQESETFSIIDGNGAERFREAMDRIDSVGAINVEQYRIIHATTDADISVLAGAGTGKTETMAERIIFLLSCVREDLATGQASALRLDEIALVTFTNEAANELRGRLARTLMLRRSLCRSSVNPPLPWLLQLASTHISTIHAFARSLIAAHGATVGIAPNFTVTGRLSQFRDVLAKVLSEPLEDLAASTHGQRVPSPHEWYRHIAAVFEHLESNGVETSKLDWGALPSDPLTAEIQELTREGLHALASHCLVAARDEQALRLNDLLPTAKQALTGSNRSGLRYVFVDEFQDTDLTQIRLFARMRAASGSRLFVVGDVKQGIYRFRGASGDAFDELSQTLTEAGTHTALRFTLTRNFRSTPGILDRLHASFASWGRAGLLAYGAHDRLRAGRQPADGGVTIRAVRSRGSYAAEAAALVEAWRSEAPEDSIGIICRRNSEALAVQTEVRNRGLSCDVAVGGRFFMSRAVRELHVLLRSITDPSDRSAAAQLLETRWAAGLMRERTRFPIGHVLVGPWPAFSGPVMTWRDRTAGLRTQDRFPGPDLTELAGRLDQLQVASAHMSPLQFIVECVREFDPMTCSQGSPDDDGTRRRYGLNLDHLLALLDAAFPNGGGSIWDVLAWLETSTALNRFEDEPGEGSPAAGATVALSAHKAKGLQFDRVLIPRTWVPFGPPGNVTTEVVVSAADRRIGWRWRTRDHVFSTLDAELTRSESSAVAGEETRLLYVAMTRAKQQLCLFVSSSRPPNPTTSGGADSWEQLILGSTL